MKTFRSKLGETGKGSGTYSYLGTKVSVIVRNICNNIKKKYPYGVLMNLHGGLFQRSGLPDLAFTYMGFTLWLEVKRPGGDTTPLQKVTLDKLKENGGFVAVVDSVEEAIDTIEEVIKRLVQMD